MSKQEKEAIEPEIIAEKTPQESSSKKENFSTKKSSAKVAIIAGGVAVAAGIGGFAGGMAIKKLSHGEHGHRFSKGKSMAPEEINAEELPEKENSAEAPSKESLENYNPTNENFKGKTRRHGFRKPPQDENSKDTDSEKSSNDNDSSNSKNSSSSNKEQ